MFGSLIQCDGDEALGKQLGLNRFGALIENDRKQSHVSPQRGEPPEKHPPAP